MKLIVSTLLLIGLCFSSPGYGEPIRLHPDNPHYLQFKGKPTVLITSAEHYGALLNLDFDYKVYFKELRDTGMNLTRVFSGAYCEPVGAFGIEHNVLAPRWNRLITPWARSDTPGYAYGGNKFDLNQWDPAYFKRLKDFMKEAAKRDVIIEYVFYCPFYKDDMWKLSPMNAANNINGYSQVKRTEAYTLQDKKLTDMQDRLVRKVVNELKDVDNLYYEICNEPYFGGVTEEWQAHIAQTIADAEKNFPHKHLIAKNIANGSQEIKVAPKHVSIYNYHYAFPPTAVKQNYKHNKVISYDESGFKGESDTVYRSHAWAFLLAGGAIFNNLDYSFTPDYENGIAKVKAPGGGSRALREQLNVLRSFIESMNFIDMKPEPSIIQSISGNKNAKAWCLANPGKEYGFYFLNAQNCEVALSLPQGQYRMEWIHTLTGKIIKKEKVSSTGAPVTFAIPSHLDDIAARIIQ